MHPIPMLGRGRLLAMLTRFEEAWPIARAAAERMAGMTANSAGEFVLGEIARLEGEAEGAVRDTSGAIANPSRSSASAGFSLPSPLFSDVTFAGSAAWTKARGGRERAASWATRLTR
jgi:hypothetical protein